MQHADDIEDPSGPKQSRLAALKTHLDEEVVSDWGDMILIMSCFVTGLLDSAIFNVWSCFVSMQTGKRTYCLVRKRRSAHKMQVIPYMLL